MAGRGLVDVLGDRSGTDERNSPNVRVLQQPVHGLFVSVQDVEDAVRKAGLAEEGCQPVCRRRILLAGFQDNRVACRNGDGKEPQGNHRGEIERADDADDAKRGLGGVNVNTAGNIFRVFTLNQVREAGRQFDDFQSAGNFAQRIRDHFAVLGGNDLGQFALALVEQLTETKHDLLTLRDRQVPPGREGLVGGGDRRLNVLGGTEPDYLRLLAKGRIKHRRHAVAVGRNLLTADPVRDNLEFVGIRHSFLFLGPRGDGNHLKPR